jgi:hypothetical protein
LLTVKTAFFVYNEYNLNVLTLPLPIVIVSMDVVFFTTFPKPIEDTDEANVGIGLDPDTGMAIVPPSETILTVSVYVPNAVGLNLIVSATLSIALTVELDTEPEKTPDAAATEPITPALMEELFKYRFKRTVSFLTTFPNETDVLHALNIGEGLDPVTGTKIVPASDTIFTVSAYTPVEVGANVTATFNVSFVTEPLVRSTEKQGFVVYTADMVNGLIELLTIRIVSVFVTFFEILPNAMEDVKLETVVVGQRPETGIFTNEAVELFRI